MRGACETLRDENMRMRDRLGYMINQQANSADSKKQALKDFEDNFKAHLKELADLEKRLSRYIKVFESQNAVAKILIRDSEVQELERKLG